MCISFFKMFNILFLRKVDLAQKNLVLPEEKFVSLILHRNAITLQHLIIQFPRCYPSSNHLRVVKSKRSEAVPSIMIWGVNFLHFGQRNWRHTSLSVSYGTGVSALMLQGEDRLLSKESFVCSTYNFHSYLLSVENRNLWRVRCQR